MRLASLSALFFLVIANSEPSFGSSCFDALVAQFDATSETALGVGTIKGLLVLDSSEVLLLRTIFENQHPSGTWMIVHARSNSKDGALFANHLEENAFRVKQDLSFGKTLYLKLLGYADAILRIAREKAPAEIPLDVMLDFFTEKGLVQREMHIHEGSIEMWMLATTAFKVDRQQSDRIGTIYKSGNETKQASHGETLVMTDVGREHHYGSLSGQQKYGICATPHCSGPGQRLVVRATVYQPLPKHPESFRGTAVFP